MAANSALQISDLDFDQVKANLIEFLRSQNQIRDYEYVGSNINTVLDLLAYNTFQSNFYLNMIANEMFLDTAQLKDSIVSHAKELNYVPRSAQGSRATVDLKILVPQEDVIARTAPDSINIDKHTKFTSTLDGTTYSFYTEDDYTILPATDQATNTSKYEIKNVELYEGRLTTEAFTVPANTGNTYSVTISNQNADTRFLTVKVQRGSEVTISEWRRANTLFGVNSSSNVFFLEPAKDEKYTVSFGDGTFGARPLQGDKVIVTYRITNGDITNSASRFKASQTFSGYNSTATTVIKSEGGAPSESIDEIRRNAPRSFQVAERAVTANDFKIITQAAFPEVENVLAFGGEEMVPPKFGKVILAVDLFNADGLPESKKLEIANYLEKRTPVGIDVQVITPDFLFVDTEATVTYNISTTSAAPDTIRNKTINALVNYANNNINRFDAIWRNSKALSAIDNSDVNIISSQLINRPFIKISPNGLTTSYKLEFNNKLKPDSVLTTSTVVTKYEAAVQSTQFTYGTSTIAYFVDDGLGKLKIVRSDSGDRFTILKSDAGTVNYETGLVNILPIDIDTWVGSVLKIFARTESRDIKTKKQSILQQNAEDIRVKVIQERV